MSNQINGGVYAKRLFWTRVVPNGAGQNFRNSLSGREQNVLLAVAAGVGIGEIAEKLHLSAKAVSTYKARALNKLQLNSTADLVRYVLTESRRI